MITYMSTQYKKILIIRQGAIGDVVHTTNIFRAIKEKYPEVQIDYLTGKVPAQLIEHDTRLNRVIKLEDKSYKYLTELGFELRREKYDLIINLQPSLRFKYLAFLCSAKRNVVYKKSFRMHAVENFFQTAHRILPDIQNAYNLELSVPDETIEKIKNDLPYLTEKKLVAVNISANAARHGRRWPVEYYKELVNLILERYDCNIIVPGGKEDIKETEAFSGMHENVHVIAGKFNILESAAISSMCDVFISGDTGPLHIASAFKKPVCIGIYGSMPVSRTGPWGENHFALSSDMDCVPCNRRRCKIKKYKNEQITPCMKEVKPEHVLRVIIDNDLL